MFIFGKLRITSVPLSFITEYLHTELSLLRENRNN